MIKATRVGWDLMQDDQLLGWVVPVQYGRGWTVRVKGVPFAKRNPTAMDRTYQGGNVNYPGTADSKAEALIIITEARK